jgi:hypothetical protein
VGPPSGIAGWTLHVPANLCLLLDVGWLLASLCHVPSFEELEEIRAGLHTQQRCTAYSLDTYHLYVVYLSYHHQDYHTYKQTLHEAEVFPVIVVPCSRLPLHVQV